jgi:glycosyltransferase involved in cell wall biosynthesis
MADLYNRLIYPPSEFTPMKTAAVIPAYNEEKTIKKVVEDTLGYVDKVIVVDDGSRDNTSELARKTEAHVITLDKNVGKAGALKRGFAETHGYDIVVMLDGDLQHCPDEIPRLVECIKEGYDLCIGSRFMGDTRSMPTSNRISNWSASILLGILGGRRIRDPQSGFRALSKRALDSLELPAQRYSIEHIMVVEAARKRFKIKEVPISCVYGEEKSHVRPVRDTLMVIKNLVGYILRSRK